MINKKNYEIWFLDYLEDNLSTEQTDQLIIFLKKYPLLQKELDEMSLYYLECDNSITFNQKTDIQKPFKDLSNIDEMMIADSEGDISVEEKLILDNLIKNNNELQGSSIYYKLSRVDSDKSIKYNDKFSLKKTKYSLDDIDTLLLSHLDNTISDSEKNWLTTHFSPESLERQLSKFRKTKLEPDLSIVYSDKKQLKREVARVIPLVWVRRAVGIAASLLLFYFGYQKINQDTTHNDNEIIVTKVSKISPKTDIKKLQKNNEKSLAENIFSHKETQLKADKTFTEPNVNTKIKNIIHSKSIEQKIDAQIVYASERKLLYTNTHLELNTELQTKELQTKYRPLLRIAPIKPISPKDQLASIEISPSVSVDRNRTINTPVNPTRDIIELEKLSNSLLGKAIASLDRNKNETGGSFNLGIFEIDVPEFLIASVEGIQESQKINQESKKNKRKVFSFSLGKFSIYHSRK